MVKQAYTVVEGADTLPKIDVEDAGQYLRDLAFAGLRKRNLAGKKEYEDRLNEELDLIIEKGFETYFIILEDAIGWCRKNRIPIGFGRGSAAGSLVTYVLYITEVDPIPYNLLFWRFLSSWRQDWPDIDTDIADKDRHRLKYYLETKYGKDKVASVTTFIYSSDKGAIKDAARVLGMPPKLSDKLSEIVGEGGEIEDLAKSVEARDIVKDYPGILRLAVALRGRLRTLGYHAAATVISNEPIDNIVSMESRKIKDSDQRQSVISLPKDATEALGFIKYDFLGLKTLSVVADCIDQVKKNHGRTLNMYELPENDPKVLAMIADGHTSGVFQFEASASTKVIKDAGVTSFDDLVAGTALVRPGAMEVMGPEYVARKKGHKKVTYPSKETESFLKDTYGLCVPYDQTVSTNLGEVPMEDIKIGDVILSESGKEELVIAKVDTGEKDCVEIELDNGVVIQLSETHPVKTIDGWKNAGDLTEDDYVIQGSSDIGLTEKTSHTKFIPNEVFSWSKKSRLAFLGFYLTCDGTVSGGYASFRTVSRNIATGLSRLMKSTWCKYVNIVSYMDGSYIVLCMDNEWFNEYLFPFVCGEKKIRLSRKIRYPWLPNEYVQNKIREEASKKNIGIKKIYRQKHYQRLMEK